MPCWIANVVLQIRLLAFYQTMFCGVLIWQILNQQCQSQNQLVTAVPPPAWVMAAFKWILSWKINTPFCRLRAKPYFEVEDCPVPVLEPISASTGKQIIRDDADEFRSIAKRVFSKNEACTSWGYDETNSREQKNSAPVQAAFHARGSIALVH